MIIKLQFFSFLICFLMCGQIMADDKNYFGGTAKIDDQRSLIFVGKEIPNNYRDYPDLISIYWDYEPVNEGGMPDDATVKVQREFENLVKFLDIESVSHQVLTMTGNGEKEWHWYVKDRNTWLQEFNQALQGHIQYPIELEVEYQPNWDFYQGFIEKMEQ